MALIVVLGTYFAVVKTIDHAALPMLQQIAMLAAALGLLGVIALGTHLIGRDRGEDAGVDERDRQIEGRAATVAYYALMAGTILVGCVMPFEASGWKIVHAAVFFIAVAEVVHSGMLIVGYRRGLRA
jgi:hypothetical protein